MSKRIKSTLPPKSYNTESFESQTVSLSPYQIQTAKHPSRRLDKRMRMSIASDTDSLSPFLNNHPEQVKQHQVQQEERKWGKRAQKIRVKRLAKFYNHHQTRRNLFLTKVASSSRIKHSKLMEKAATVKSLKRFFRCTRPYTANRDLKIQCEILQSLGLLLAVTFLLLIGALCLQTLQTNKPTPPTSTNITNSVISRYNLNTMLSSYKTRCPLRNPQTKPSFWRSAQKAVLFITTVRAPASLPNSISGRMFVVVYFIVGVLFLLCFLACFVALMQETVERFLNLFFQNSDSGTGFTLTVLKLVVSLLPLSALISLLGISLYLKDRALSLTSVMYNQVFTITTVGDAMVLSDSPIAVAKVVCWLLQLGLVANVLCSGIKVLRAVRTVICFCSYTNTGDSRYSTEVQPGSLDRGFDEDEL